MSEQFWSSDEGILLRLEDLSHDFTFKTYNGALKGSFREAGFKSLMWVAVVDKSTCEECLGLNGNTYPAWGFLPKMPRHPHCRCMFDIFMEM